MGNAEASAFAAAAPELRQGLRLFMGPHGARGPGWLVYEPGRPRHFEIARAAFELLQLWRAEPIADMAVRAGRELMRDVAQSEVEALAKFLMANNLVLQPPKDDARALAAQEVKARQSKLVRLVHGYLFFKVPIVRPDRFLRATMPLVAPLFSRPARWSVVVVSMLGLYLTSRQLDEFVATFIGFLSWEGAAIYLVSLLCVKVLHELGHAYTATRAGVRVNTMGVAFMILTPVLYTDVTDAWRLRDQRDKIAIDAAGIVVELALAGVALFLWAFLPDGPLRSAAFVTATASLVMGLMINLNPLMRFDGYFLLSDAWRMHNLQARSNDLAVWWLREKLFALGKPAPETVAKRQQSMLVAYAFFVWVYRFFLFIGIALIVYHMFFKVLGIILFVVEILWLIALPIFREIREWWNMRQEIVRSARSAVTLGMVLMIASILAMPWNSTLMLQAVVQSGQETILFAPRPARVVEVVLEDGKTVERGQVLLRLEAPDLDHKMSQTRRQIELLELRLARVAGDQGDRSMLTVLGSEMARHRAILDGIERERERLAISAAHDGVVRDADPDLANGEWINETKRVGRVVDGREVHAVGYLGEQDVWRLRTGAVAKFVPEDPLLAPRHGRLSEIERTGARSLELPYLTSVFGGAVASDHGADGEIRPRSGRHLVRVRLEGEAPWRAIRGTLHLSGESESMLAAIWRQVLRVLVRESGV